MESSPQIFNCPEDIFSGPKEVIFNYCDLKNTQQIVFPNSIVTLTLNGNHLLKQIILPKYLKKLTLNMDFDSGSSLFISDPFL